MTPSLALLSTNTQGRTHTAPSSRTTALPLSAGNSEDSLACTYEGIWSAISRLAFCPYLKTRARYQHQNIYRYNTDIVHVRSAAGERSSTGRNASHAQSPGACQARACQVTVQSVSTLSLEADTLSYEQIPGSAPDFMYRIGRETRALRM